MQNDQMSSLMPFLQMMMQQRSQGSNPFASPVGGSSAPVIPVNQPRSSNVTAMPTPQLPQPGQQGGGLSGLVNTGQNIQKLYGMGNSMFGSNTPPASGNGSPQASTSGLSPNYQASPQLTALQNTPVTQASMAGDVQQSNSLFPSNATQQAWQQSQQPWYSGIFGGSGSGTSGGMFGGVGANGAQPTGFFSGMAGDASQGLSTPGAAGVGQGGTSSMFGSAGANGAGATAAENPSWLQSLWELL